MPGPQPRQTRNSLAIIDGWLELIKITVTGTPRFDQRAEIAIAGKQHDLIDVLCNPASPHTGTKHMLGFARARQPFHKKRQTFKQDYQSKFGSDTRSGSTPATVRNEVPRRVALAL
jgi:hypothetical protein